MILIFSVAWIRSPSGGGWLKKLTALCNSNSNLNSNSNRSDGQIGHYGQSGQSSNGSITITKKILRILEYKSELQSLLRRSNKDYESKISLLPIKARLCILRHAAYNSILSPGQNVYFQLLKHPISSSQKILREDATLTLDSFEYFLICLLRYATTDANVPVLTQSTSGEKKSFVLIFFFFFPFSPLLSLSF